MLNKHYITYNIINVMLLACITSINEGVPTAGEGVVIVFLILTLTLTSMKRIGSDMCIVSMTHWYVACIRCSVFQ